MMQPWSRGPSIAWGIAAFLAATLANGACAPECLFIDQSEDGISIGVWAAGDISVLNADYPEGAWICGGLVLPPGTRGTWPPRPMPHRPIPEGEWTLEALARDVAPRNDSRVEATGDVRSVPRIHRDVDDVTAFDISSDNSLDLSFEISTDTEPNARNGSGCREVTSW